MKKALWMALAIAMLSTALAATVAQAGPFKRREARQRARIHQGVASGELTPGETKRLHREQRAIERRREQALADGHIGPREAAALEHTQDKASHDIYQLKHNEREMPGAE